MLDVPPSPTVADGAPSAAGEGRLAPSPGAADPRHPSHSHPPGVSRHVALTPRRLIPVIVVQLAAWTCDMAVAVAVTRIAGLGERWLVAAAGIITICGLMGSAYDPDKLVRWQRGALHTINAWTGAALVMLALMVDREQPAISTGVLIGWWWRGVLLALAGRVLVDALLGAARRAGLLGHRAAVVGCPQHAAGLVDVLRRDDGMALHAVGYFSDRQPAPPQDVPLPSLGGVDQLLAMIRAKAIDRVYVTLPWHDQPRLRALVAVLSTTSVEVMLAPDAVALAMTQRSVTMLSGVPMFSLQGRPLPSGDWLLKEICDRLAAAALLAFFLPMMLAVAIAIRLDSRGPVLFRQVREGFNGAMFPILKFRTMTVGDTPELIQAQRRDPRVTRVGRFLRRSSLDELPQLVNVLAGQMSIVGPRPHAVATRAGGRLFTEITSSYPMRHRVKPGLTGWAQVCGWRGETSTENMLLRRLDHDLHYVEHWSLGFDVKILALTAIAVLFPRNAY